MTRVLIVVAIRLYREGLAQLLDGQNGFTVVATESSCRVAAGLLDQVAPDVALVEMGIPDLDVMAGALAAFFAMSAAPAMAGDDSTRARVAKVQTALPAVVIPWTSLSRPPSTTRSVVTAAEE